MGDGTTIREDLSARGIRRLGGPRNGFRYRGPRGGAISSADRLRIAHLKIPPGWTEVSIARSRVAAVQVVGRDGGGRWQYLYREALVKRRSRSKFDRIFDFAQALPRLRRVLARDLRLRGLPRDKALACAVALLSTCFLRAGSEEYAADHGSFGLATLRRRHVEVKGDRIRLDYPGKHGVRQRHERKDARLARIVAAMLRLPGAEVLQYREPDGSASDVSRWQINRYIRRAMGGPFTARDFRTWAGTLICAGALARRAASARGPASRRHAVAQAIHEAAGYLGNTDEACRSSYVHPAILGAFDAEEVVRCAHSRDELAIPRGAAGLHPSERALLDLLERRRAISTKR
jgi:DNA topoisomerase-1